MSAITIQQMAVRVLRLMDQRADRSGADVGRRLRREARKLPLDIRRAAERLAAALEDAENPKLLLTIDEAQVAADYDLVLSHLTIRPGYLRQIAASVAGAAMVSVVLLGGVAIWAMAA